MKKLLAVSVVLLLWSMQVFGSQSKLSQFSALTPKQKAALQARLAARAQAGYAATPGRPALTHGALAAPNTGPNAVGKTRSPRSHPNNNPPSNPPVNPVGFVSATQIPAGGLNQWSAVEADFNGDGKPDIAAPVQTGTPSTYAVSVVLNAGSGTFKPAQLTPNPNGVDGDQILTGDFNGDGKQDLIVSHGTNPATFEVWLGNGDGTFNVQNNALTTITSNYVVGGVVTGPDANGNYDLLFVDAASPANVWTFLGNGDGTFQTPTSVAVSGGPLANVVFADFNGDGILDFAASPAPPTYGPNVVYLGQANGTYVAGTPLSNPDGVYYICNNSAGDLNGDGKPEIVSANCYNSGSGAAGNLTVYLNNGDGTFQTGVYYSAGTESLDSTVAYISPLAVTIADVNGDGKNDIVSSNHDGGDVTILLGNGDGTVKVPTVGYGTGGFPRTSALVADFNGDGFADIIVPDYEFSFAFLSGYGDGTFRSALDYYSPVPGGYDAGGNTIASGDFNGDGYPDFVIGNYGYNPNTPSGIGITVFLSNPDGSLQPGVNYATGGSYQGVTVGYFDGDTKLDIAAVNQSNNGVQIFRGNGDGTFSLGSYYPTGGTDALTIATGDFNGYPDLAVANSTGDNVSVLLNNGTGVFTAAPSSPYPTTGSNQAIAVADVNNDGILDLVVTEYNPGVVAVMLGNADGTFQPAITTSLGYNHLGNLALGDLNGDGNLDLAVTVADPSVGTGLAVAKGNGDGSFQPAVLYATTLQNLNLADPYPGDVQMLDLNGNGQLDLVYSNTGYGTVGVLYNTGTNPFAVGMFYDPVEYPAGSNVFALALADVNQDGAVDVVAANNNYAGATVLLNATGSVNTLASSANPAAASQTITFTATVSANVRGVTAVPTGTVTFLNGATSLGSATLTGGVATFNVSTLAVGTYSITAQYSGDSNFHSRTSTVLSQVVTLATDATLLASSLNPAPVGQSVTFTATITSTSGGTTATPTGTVTFSDGSTLLGPTPLTGGVATFSTSSLALGNHSITAQYSGDANFASASSGLTQVVVAPDFSLAATPPSVTVNPGASALYTVSVTPINGYNGTVTFTCGTLPATVACASFSPTSVTPSGNAVSTTLTITTAAATASFATPARPNSKPIAPTLWASLSALGLFGLVLAGSGRKRNRWMAVLLGIMLMVMTFTLFGCSGGGSNTTPTPNAGTPAGNYTISVTAAGTGTGSPTHSMNVTLVVQ
ncbi:MAG: FG-GAP-like repeat-containing protein [Candidatus Sulfotelmatobacter sp.]|jgi:hypothetical protein